MAPPLEAGGIRHDPIDDDLPIGNNTFDANVIMVILAVLVSALICSLVLNSIIKCAFKCSSLILAHSSSNRTNNPSAANRGIKKKALKAFPVITYTTELKHSGIDSQCVICLSKFAVREKIKVLPKCNHEFHVKCIDKWLNSHSSCPICRRCLIETCQKINDGSHFSSNNTLSSAAVQEIIIRIEPLQHEDVVSNNQN
ncbi:hypothetical protein RND71_022029 [Anisodus tanguticus]|uniref:RING-type E3 ubiquitin transferase n=1 Tax=Anisodus tanguticus TaxID=243964 RepID=A0AAE1VGP9_9SOLA|nr:hypothetical protein RND71_022029 [Anisodus tanguticus]